MSNKPFRADILEVGTITAQNSGPVIRPVEVSEAILKADPVTPGPSTGQVRRAKANTEALANVIGVAVAAQSVVGEKVGVVSDGLAEGVLTGATPGTIYYLQSTGGIGPSLPGSGSQIVIIGTAWTSTDLWVQLQNIGQEAG